MYTISQWKNPREREGECIILKCFKMLLLLSCDIFLFMFFSSFNPEMSDDIRRNITQYTKQINDILRISDGSVTWNSVFGFWECHGEMSVLKVEVKPSSQYTPLHFEKSSNMAGKNHIQLSFKTLLHGSSNIWVSGTRNPNPSLIPANIFHFFKVTGRQQMDIFL